MLAFGSRQLLKELLIEIGKEEKQLEVLRQILCEQYDFEPYAAFRRIDRTRKGYVTNIDILEFLMNSQYRFTDLEASYFVRHYDRDNDGRLAYLEFLPSVLPLDNPELRTTATQRKVYDVGYDELLPYEVEYALARLIAQEIEFYKALDPIKVALISEYDFTYFDAFATIDIYETGYIDYYNLKNFLKEGPKKPADDILIAVLRRIDKDDDGRISFDEFVESIQPQDPSFPKSQVKKLKKSIVQQPLKKSGVSVGFRSPTKNRATSPRGSKKVSRVTSPVRTTTQKAKMSQSGTNFKKESVIDSPKKKALIHTREPVDLNKSLRQADGFNDLIKIFREVISMERELEFAKQDLALRNDFNPFDAYRFFDRKGKEVITVPEVEQAFGDLGIYPSREDIFLFIKRFDKTGDGKLRFSDFGEGFIPLQTEYARLLKSRTPINGDLFFDCRSLWTQTTIRQFKNIVLLHLETEAVVEALRQKLSKEADFNFKEAFERIDYDEDGFLSVLELRVAMDREGVFVTEKDVQYLVNRCDKDEDLRVSYVEFVHEMTPKSKKKY